MLHRFGLLLLVLGLPGVARAQETPDRLLPPGSQLFLHWDGFDKHQEAYGKTAIAKMMKGDTGKFLRAVLHRIREQGEMALSGQLDKELVQTLIESCTGILETAGKNGFALGVELRKVEPVQVEAVLVLPGGGRGEKSLLSLLQAVLKLSGKEAQQVEAVGRKVQHLDGGEVHLVWWGEGADAVLAFGTDPPESLVRRLFKGKTKLTDRSLYKQVRGFEEFSTWARGFVDLTHLGKVVRARGANAARLVDDLGLDSLKSLTFYSGFDGPAELGVVELHLAGPRKGLLRILGKQKFTLADLPPLPQDITSFSADNLELSEIYPAVVQTVEAVVRLLMPEKLKDVQSALQEADAKLGLKIGEDLFGSLGNLLVQYSAWAEGPLGLGQVTLIKLKDSKKLEKALARLVKGLAGVGFSVRLKTRTYHGAKLHEVGMAGPGGFLFGSPTYTIYKDWLAVSVYPQPVEGFILRARGELPAWQASERMHKLLAPFPREMTGLSVSDPRPGLKLLLSVTPALLAAVNSTLEQLGLGVGSGIDVSLVPNAYEATRHLFPNITVITDDGNKVRPVTRSSLPFPF
jgi:hypothetical protein